MHPSSQAVKTVVLYNLLKATTSMDWMFSDSPSLTSSSSMIASIDSTLASSMIAVICIFLMP